MRSPRLHLPRMALALCLCLCLLASCDIEDDRLTSQADAASAPALLNEALEASWRDGRIRHEVLTGHHREVLERFAKRLAEHGPSSDPSGSRLPWQHVAHHANAHNGLALLSWLRADSARSGGDIAWDPAWSRVKHAVDGERLSLDELADRVRLQGGREAGLLLSRGRHDDPLLPGTAYSAETFNADREAQLRFALNEEDLFSSTSGNVVGPHWLGELLDPPAPGSPEGLAEPLDAQALTIFLSEHLRIDHPLRPEILRAARDGTLVLEGADPTLNPGVR